MSRITIPNKEECHMRKDEYPLSRIFQLQEQSGIADTQFEIMFGLKSHTIAEWKRDGSSSYMKILPKIAKYFGVTTDWLLGIEETSYDDDKDIIPIVGEIHAGMPLEMYETVEDYVSLPKEYSKSGSDCFALRVKGESMLPLLMNNDVIIIKKNQSNYNEKICVVKLNGDEATLKKVEKSRNKIRLIPLNPMYQTLEYSEKEAEEKCVEILGVMIQSIRNY